MRNEGAMDERHETIRYAFGQKPPSPIPCPLSPVLKKLIAFSLALLLIKTHSVNAQTDYLASFSDPSQIWGNGIERVIEEAYRQCFITRIIGTRIMNIRIPFAENNERDILLESGWDFVAGGKGNPQLLFPLIEEILDTFDFNEYISALSTGRERVFIFDMPQRKWSVSDDPFDIARMKAGSYRGLPHRPYVLTAGNGPMESDVYNYLYCVGYIGMDCSAFVWYVLQYIGRQGGIDLSEILRPFIGNPRGTDPARFIGTSFFGSRISQMEAVDDKIRNLRPADIILFRDENGNPAHSAIIQSIDLSAGVIRYLQCTDEAPLAQRGVHESFIYFDPANTDVSLGDPLLNWTQKRFSPFPGERDSPFSDDGERYRAFGGNGGGSIVRLRAIETAVLRINSL